MAWLFGLVFAFIILFGMERRLVDNANAVKELENFTQQSRDKIAMLEKQLEDLKKTASSEKTADQQNLEKLKSL
ncbi:hypothetical protein KAU39_02990 [bacterium]|nr:hypothetical protein [bacterium]